MRPLLAYLIKIFVLVYSFVPIGSLFVYFQNYEYLSTIKLNDYGGYYGNVKLSRYLLPSDVLSAIWRIQIVATEACPATNVYFYLDYSGYPVISPYNSTFPENFTPGRLTKTYVKRLVGGRNNSFRHDVYLNVSSPYPGYWFSASFIDVNDQKVKPDLLKSNCSFYLTPSVSIWQINDTVVLYPNQTFTSTPHTVFKLFKYISTSYNGPLTFRMQSNERQNQTSSCMLTALLRQSAFPDMNEFKKNNNYTVCNGTATECQLSVEYPLLNTWYYMAISSDCDYQVDVNATYDCQTAAEESQTPARSQLFSSNQSVTSLVDTLFPNVAKINTNLYCPKMTPPIETFRFIGPTYFSVKYYFNSNYNRSNTLLVRNERKPYFIEFVVDFANNGGTLNFYLGNNLIYDPSYAAAAAASYDLNPEQMTTTKTSTSTASNVSTDEPNKLIKNKIVGYDFSSKVNDFNLANIKVMLRVCLLFNSMEYTNCPYGYELTVQTFTHIFTNLQLSIPYPMIGKWYLAIVKECYDINTNESAPCPTAYVPYTIIQIVSDQCANNYCGDYGTCYIINSLLNLVSACKCSGGYEGYGCTDGRKAVPARLYLASVLFLTTSNLVFLLPICLAIYRRWYIESLVYFYNMFFSTFYHACDQEFYSFCIFNYDGLQLADFISSYSSFVITILSMSAFVRPWKVFTFFVGLLACMTINLYDRFSNVAFVVFLSIAISVTVMTWVKICVSKRKFHPSRKVLLKFYLPGFILAITGILIYSFLQTKSNYWILHSIWHMCMASSIVFFLPKRDTADFKVSNTGESLKAALMLDNVATTTSSLSDSTGSTSSPQSSPQALLHTNATEITLLEQ